jgi:hypothetical protein
MRNHFVYSQHLADTPFAPMPPAFPTTSLHPPDLQLPFDAGRVHQLPADKFGTLPFQNYHGLVDHEKDRPGSPWWARSDQDNEVVGGAHSQLPSPQQPKGDRLDPKALLLADRTGATIRQQPLVPSNYNQLHSMAGQQPTRAFPEPGCFISPAGLHLQAVSSSFQPDGLAPSFLHRQNKIHPSQNECFGIQKSKEQTQKLKKNTSPLRFVAKRR